MKTTIVVAVFFFILAGCNNRADELEKQNGQLQTTNSMLSQDLASRDGYIEEVTVAINDVYNNLESVRAKEKNMLKGTEELNATTKMTSAQVRQKVKDQITSIGSELKENRERLDGIQSKLKSYKTQFAGLNKMVENLKHSLEEREQMLAQMNGKIKDLEQEVTEKTQLVSQKEQTIGEQQTVINTAYYAIGTRDELEKKGIISKEGGFMWGLLGSTTVLASGFDNTNFKPIDKTASTAIEVNGKIDEILPRRNIEFYQQSADEGNHSTIKITRPDRFWQDKYLVIITG
jgi:archaellum component FlaC